VFLIPVKKKKRRGKEKRGMSGEVALHHRKRFMNSSVSCSGIVYIMVGYSSLEVDRAMKCVDIV